MISKKHALTFVTVTVFIDVIGFGIIMPIMPQLLMELTGQGAGEASKMSGTLLFVYACLQFLFAPVLGNLSDRYGRRPLLLLSLGFYGVNYFLMGFADSLLLLFIGRILTGITSSTYSVANALIADVSPPEERAQNFGLLGMAFGLGFIFGPVLGGVIGEWDTRAPFFAAGILALCNVTYGYFVLEETLPESSRRSFDISRANPLGALARIKKYPILLGPVLCLLLYNIGHHVYPTNWNFYAMQKFAWTPIDIGISLGFVGILMAIVQGGLIRVVIPKLGAPRTAMLGFSASAAAYIGIAYAPNGFVLYLWCGVSALSGLIMPALQSMMSSQVPANEQGELQGIVATVSSIGAIIGPPLLSYTFAFFISAQAPIHFPGAAFLVAGILTIVACTIFLSNLSKLIIATNTQGTT